MGWDRKISPAEQDALKFMGLGLRDGRLITDLNAEGQSLIWRAGDLRARWLLNGLAEKVYVPYSKPECAAVAKLIHAYHYLADRLAYELAPHPKNMMRLETIDESCPHCKRIIVEPDGCSECGLIFCSLKCTLEHAHVEQNLSKG
jgi:hypothetical protein